MKTPHPLRNCFPWRAALTAVLIGLLDTSAAVPPATPADSEAKDHTLFVGTDLAVRQDGKFYHVVGANKDSLTIEEDHGAEEVHKPRGRDIRVTKGVKLSNLFARIANVKTDSVDRAAARAQLDALRNSMILLEEASMTEDRLHGDMIRSQYFRDHTVDTFHGDDPTLNNPEYELAAQKYLKALPGLQLMTDQASTSVVQNATRPLESAPAVALSFNVSAPKPIEHPYVIVVASYASDDHPDVVERQVSARSFDRLDSKGQRVNMSHPASLGGLPFKKFDVAVFANGQEVATNLSEKRKDLTDDEAYQFFLMDYLTAHKGATVRPTPMLMTPRADFRREVGNLDLNQTIYTTVDQSGKVLTLTTDQAGTRQVPPALEAIFQHVRFMPALKDGAPVEGHLKFTLADLTR